MISSTIAVGIDITEVARVRRLLLHYGERFIAHILGDVERKLLAQRPDPAQFVAGRFAAKEAALKALGRYLSTRPSFGSIQIIPGDTGRPTLHLSGIYRELPTNVSAIISISHEREYATAIVILSENSNAR